MTRLSAIFCAGASGTGRRKDFDSVAHAVLACKVGGSTETRQKPSSRRTEQRKEASEWTEALAKVRHKPDTMIFSYWYQGTYQDCNPKETDMRFTTFEECEIKSMDFKDCNLEGSRFVKCTLTDCTFSGCNLCGADFGDAALSAPPLTGRSLRQRYFRLRAYRSLESAQSSFR